MANLEINVSSELVSKAGTGHMQAFYDKMSKGISDLPRFGASVQYTIMPNEIVLLDNDNVLEPDDLSIRGGKVIGMFSPNYDVEDYENPKRGRRDPELQKVEFIDNETTKFTFVGSFDYSQVVGNINNIRITGIVYTIGNIVGTTENARTPDYFYDFSGDYFIGTQLSASATMSSLSKGNGYVYTPELDQISVRCSGIGPTRVIGLLGTKTHDDDAFIGLTLKSYNPDLIRMLDPLRYLGENQTDPVRPNTQVITSEIHKQRSIRSVGGIKVSETKGIWICGHTDVVQNPGDGEDLPPDDDQIRYAFHNYLLGDNNRYVENRVFFNDDIPVPDDYNLCAFGSGVRSDELHIFQINKEPKAEPIDNEEVRWVGRLDIIDLSGDEPTITDTKLIDYEATLFDDVNIVMETCYYDAELNQIIVEAIKYTSSTSEANSSRHSIGIVLAFDVAGNTTGDDMVKFVSYQRRRNTSTTVSTPVPTTLRDVLNRLVVGPNIEWAYRSNLNAVTSTSTGDDNEPFALDLYDWKNLQHYRVDHNNSRISVGPLAYVGPMTLADISIPEVVKTEDDLLRVVVEMTVNVKKVTVEPTDS